MCELAIVIPAYKNKYFEKTLISLANQTCKNFTVYIGDDNSPHDLKSIIKKFENKLHIQYTKFENNIGGENLVYQWKRSVELTNQEEWLWLFSDDDLIDKNCVENFFVEKQKYNSRFDIYQFDYFIIDEMDRVVATSPESPSIENSEEMAYNLLLGKRGNVMPNKIFSRNIYEKSGGFVFTKYAQAADWATTILFSKDKGISTIPNAKLYWRLSGNNISSVAFKNRKKMLFGHFQFIKWLLRHFNYLKDNTQPVTYKMIKDAAVLNLMNIIIDHYKGIEYKQVFKLIKFMHFDLELSYYKSMKNVFGILKKTDSHYKKIRRIKNKYTT